MTEHNTRDELETRMAEQTAEVRRSREQEIELRQILDLVPQLIAVYGPNREGLYANRVFSSMEVLVSKSGGTLLVAADTFTLMTSSRSAVFLITLLLVALLANWSCDYASVMECIAGSWLALTHCATSRDRLRVGM
jgi:hypothetical protein